MANGVEKTFVAYDVPKSGLSTHELASARCGRPACPPLLLQSKDHKEVQSQWQPA